MPIFTNFFMELIRKNINIFTTFNQACRLKANCLIISPRPPFAVVPFLNPLCMTCNVQLMNSIRPLYPLSFNPPSSSLQMTLFMFISRNIAKIILQLNMLLSWKSKIFFVTLAALVLAKNKEVKYFVTTSFSSWSQHLSINPLSASQRFLHNQLESKWRSQSCSIQGAQGIISL